MENFRYPLAASSRDESTLDCATIDRHIHTVVSQYHPSPEQACAWYAMLGTIALRRLYPASNYGFFAGTFEIEIGPDPEDEEARFALCFNAHEPLIPDLEFHSWIAHPEPVQRTYTEVIDFSARYYEARAREFGLPWNRDPIPDFIWTNIEGLREMKVRQLRPVDDLTLRLSQFLLQDAMFHEAWQALQGSLRLGR